MTPFRETPVVSLDELITEQTKAGRVAPKRYDPELARQVLIARLILQQRCRVCHSILDEEARCSECGVHQ